MHHLQKDKLLHQKIKSRSRKKTGIEEILSMVPETYGTQRGEEMKKGRN